MSDPTFGSAAAAVAELPPERLRSRFPADSFPPTSMAIAPLTSIAGQERACAAITFGLGMDADGYNIVISGLPNSGRSSAARDLIGRFATAHAPAKDWIYVHNFAEPVHPKAASLPAGLGTALQRDVTRLIDACRKELPQAFESEGYQERSRQVLEPMTSAREAALEKMQRGASLLGFGVNITPIGFVAIPIGQDGRPLTPEVLNGLPPDLREAIERRGQQVEALVAGAMKELRKIERDTRDAVAAMDADVATFTVGHILDDLVADFGQHGLAAHFEAVREDVLANIDRFKQLTPASLRELPAQVVQQLTDEREALLRRYGVNLLVSQGTAVPVVEERNPTYLNLLGRIDYEARFGSLMTDFSRVRPGALHRANGGYIILRLEDLLSDPRSWLMLKRTLKTGELRIEGVGELMVPLPSANLVPEGIPFSARVILIAEPTTVAILDLIDPELRQLFKVRAEFEPDLPAGPLAFAAYAAFVRRVADECALAPFDREALAEVAHFGARLAGRQDRLASQMGAIGDLCKEAAYLAKQAGAGQVGSTDVRAAIDARRERASLVPDRLLRLIADGTLRVETEGRVVGQINGLAVYQLGTQAFGVPMRISCRTGVGRRGVIDIEREVERSGAIHSKGVLVLNGYLLGAFGRRRQLAFTASLTFEQSYDDVEGDSASSAELYVILCSLAGLPIRQDVAATGSVDQFGRIQAVGGVTQKIEGFYDVCKQRGLTGTQGVIIPLTNVVDLTLVPEIIDAVRRGEFHIWPIETIGQGIEVLTGIPAGEHEGTFGYPEGTVFHAVAVALDSMGAAVRAMEGSPHAE
ncbi:MAG: AAA family ATPase [Chloroflexi bacterium]|nr:AAA family ATPase [Chloroflexota bacterium]